MSFMDYYFKKSQDESLPQEERDSYYEAYLRECGKLKG